MARRAGKANLGEEKRLGGGAVSVLPPEQREVLAELGPVAEALRFYLAGGTAVALHLRHRISIDFDWFTAEEIPDALRLAADLRSKGVDLAVGETKKGTLHGAVRSVRTSFLSYAYPLLRPLVSMPEYRCSLAHPEDLAVMKLAAIAQRGARRDFIDLRFLLDSGIGLSTALELYKRKYRTDELAHVVASLTYFDDAERDAMPRMLVPFDWEALKGTFRREIPDLLE